MTKTKALMKMTVALLAMAAPGQLAAASSDATATYSLVASSDPSNPLSKSFSGPAPKFFDAVWLKGELKQPWPGGFFINQYLNASFIDGYALYDYSMMKARLTSDVVLSGSTGEFDETVSSYGSLSISTRDNISFLGIGAGKTATLYLGNYADIETKYHAIWKGYGNEDDPYKITTNTQFSFTTKAVIFDSINDYLSERARPKYSHRFNACDGTRSCEESELLRGGNRQLSSFFEVDSDDVLVLTTDLFLSNFLSVAKPAGSYASLEATYRTDFGNSGYTFLKMLTPGTGYASESGETYLTELPAAVPEPQSWAMLIIGFGVVGSVMRRTEQRRNVRPIAG